MPNIIVFISENHRLQADVKSALSATFKQLCIGTLQAKESNVHVCYLHADIGVGTPIYVEVKLRKEVFRTKPVMTEFVNEVDALIREQTGLVARIRCFSYDNDSIHAKN